MSNEHDDRDTKPATGVEPSVPLGEKRSFRNASIRELHRAAYWGGRKRNPRDLAAGLDRLVAPAMQQAKQPFLHSAPASCVVGAQCREAYRQPANSTGSSRRRQ